MSPTTQPEVLTAREVAELFAVDAKTVTRWASRGKIRHFRTPSGQPRFRREDVEALLEPAAPEAVGQ